MTTVEFKFDKGQMAYRVMGENIHKGKIESVSYLKNYNNLQGKIMYTFKPYGMNVKESQAEERELFYTKESCMLNFVKRQGMVLTFSNAEDQS